MATMSEALCNAAVKIAPIELESLRIVANAVSTCHDKKVGARLYTRDSTLCGFDCIATGYNDTSECNNICSKSSGGKCAALHAEMAAIASKQDLRVPLVCISTLEPCMQCTKALMLAGVELVIFGEPTNPSKSGRDAWCFHYGRKYWRQVDPA